MEIKLRLDVTGALLTGKGPEIVQNNLDAAITEAALFLDKQVKALTPQGVGGAQGGLIATIDHAVVGKGTPLIKGVVFHSSKYGDVIEKGRRPGKYVPVDPLRDWIKEKLKITNEKELASVSFLINRKIKKHGFGGAHMFEKAFNKNVSEIQNIFDRYGIIMTKELNK